MARGSCGSRHPRYLVMYNGTQERPEHEELCLSDAFNRLTPGFEWTAAALNVNRGHNGELMGACRFLQFLIHMAP